MRTMRRALPIGLLTVVLLSGAACGGSPASVVAAPPTTPVGSPTTPVGSPPASVAPPASSVAAPDTTAIGSTSAPPTSATGGQVEPPPSLGARRWMETVETVVRAVRPTPPEAARLYAYAATAYADALDAGAAGDQAAVAAIEVMRVVRPDSVDAWTAVGRSLSSPSSVAALPAAVLAAAVGLEQRARTDGFASTPAPERPAGDGLWVATDGKPPLSPSAGGWMRWLVAGSTFSVPAPPAPASPEQHVQLEAVRRAVAARDARWADRITFWGGAPGTNTPAGIWQDVLWHELSGTPRAASDADYARVQADLARTVADAFLETWLVKFRYWTARPDMVDPTLPTAMADPRFPGYVSGHSTVSAAAAMLLGLEVPEKANVWMADAEEARDSRLMAGIHFPVDNEAGFTLGQAIGKVAFGALARASTGSPGPVEPRPMRLTIPHGVLVAAALPTPHGVDPSAPADGAQRMTSAPHSPGSRDGSGVLLQVSKVGYDRTFLLAMAAGDLGRNRPAPGWTVTTVSKDPVWTPAECGGMPTLVVGGRWVTYLEARAADDGSFVVTLVAFDLTTRRFTVFRPDPGDRDYDGQLLAATGDSVDLGLAPWAADGSVAGSTTFRRLDLRDGTYRDHEMLLPSFDGTPAPVDGIGRGAIDEHGDVPFLRADGAVHARVHAYRDPSPLAWSGPYGYLFAHDGTDAADPGPYALGVYDIRTGSWDWVFEHATDLGGFLVVGTRAV